MSWLDTFLERGKEAQRQPAELPVPKPVKPRSKPEIKCAWFQTRPPHGDQDCGEVEAVCYSVADGVLTVCDEHGRPIGTVHHLRDGEDPKATAVRLARASWIKSAGTSDFNRPLNYQPWGIA